MPPTAPEPERPDWMSVYVRNVGDRTGMLAKLEAFLASANVPGGASFEKLGEIIQDSRDLDTFLLGDGDQRISRSKLGMNYRGDMPSSGLVYHTKTEVWSPDALRAVCQEVPDVVADLIGKSGLTSDQYAAIADGITSAQKQLETDSWHAFEIAVHGKGLNIALPGGQALLRAWIAGCRKMPGRIVRLDVPGLDSGLAEMPEEALKCLPTWAGWNENWLRYIGLSPRTLPESFWGAAYAAIPRGQKQAYQVSDWPCFVQYPYLAQELGVSGTVKYPESMAEGAKALKRAWRDPISQPTLGWKDWHVVNLESVLERTASSVVSNGSIQDVEQLVLAIKAWPAPVALPRAVLSGRELSRMVGSACVERWRSERAGQRDWERLLTLPPAEVSDMAALYLRFVEPNARASEMERLDGNHRLAWSLLWQTDSDEDARRMGEDLATMERERPWKSQHQIAEERRLAKEVLQERRRQLSVAKARDPKVAQPRIAALPPLAEIVERLQFTSMSQLGREYGVSDTWVRKVLIAGGVDLATLPRRKNSGLPQRPH